MSNGTFDNNVEIGILYTVWYKLLKFIVVYLVFWLVVLSDKNYSTNENTRPTKFQTKRLVNMYSLNILLISKTSRGKYYKIIQGWNNI